METTNKENQPVGPSTDVPVSATPTPTETTVPQAKAPLVSGNILSGFSRLPLRLKLALSALLILFFAILILILLSMLRRPPQSIVLADPSPTPGPTFSPIPRVTSEFAKTESFVHFEENLKTLQNDTATVDLEETNLVFPLLDMSVNFGQ